MITGFPLLTAIVFFPLAGALLLLLLPDKNAKSIRLWSNVVALITFLLSLFLLRNFQGGSMHFQFIEKTPWIPQLGIDYHLGVDGISIWLVLLTTFLTCVSLIFSAYVGERVKAYHILLLILETAMLGVFVSLDMVLFFTFFEATLIPMYFLIHIWGGKQRAYAALKFFLFTAAGSIFMLLGMIAIFFMMRDVTGAGTFNLIAIQEQVAIGALWKNFMHLQTLIFWAFALGFLVKMPMFPFHTWLPDAHVEAPTAGSIILAGVLLKMGTYGFLRFCLPLFPEAVAGAVLPLTILCVIGILYGGIVAAVQPDLKKLVAYSSVAHMGFVMIGIVSLTHEGLVGGSYQQLNHGISTGALFLLIGLIYERRHTRMFADFGGLKAQMPIYAAVFMITMFSSVGLPGLNGFVGEFLAMMGAFRAGYAGLFGLNVFLPALACTGVVVAAVYLLVMFMKVFYGPNTNPENQRLKDLKPWEIALVGSLVVFMFWGGLYPNTFMKPTEKALSAVRHMALNPEGQRPIWANPDHEIDEKGNFVLAAPGRSVDGLEEISVQEIVVPANLYFENATQVTQNEAKPMEVVSH